MAVIEQTWTHLGVKITFDPDRAHFYASAPGKKLNAASLSAIKAQIDKLNLSKFDPFDAYVEYWERTPPAPDQYETVAEYKSFPSSSGWQRTDCLVKVSILSLDQSEGKMRFRIAADARNHSGRELGFVYPATEDTIKAWTALKEADYRKEERLQQLTAEVGDADKALSLLRIVAKDHNAIDAA